MKQKLSQIFILLFIASAFTSFAHKETDALDWQSKHVVADGKITEWPNPLRFYDDKSRINYTITNDRNNLYLCMKVSDETSQRKILHGGVEFRIDTLEKKSFPIGFIFPIANEIVMEKHSDRELHQEPKPGEKRDYSTMSKKMLNHATEAQLTGFKPPLTGIISLVNNPSGLSAAITIDSLGILYYEAIIPFKTFYKNELTGADTNRVFSYEIKVNALPAPPMHTGGEEKGAEESGMEGGGQHGGGGMGGGGHHGGGGMGGGGMHGGGHGSGNGVQPGNSELYVNNHVTKKLRFAFK